MACKILVTRRIPEEGLRALGGCDVEVSDSPLTREEIIERVKDKDGLICLLSETIDREVMDAAPALRVIANYAVGYDNIDVGRATERGIFVCNTPGVLTDATADLAWTLMLAAARCVVDGDAMVRSGAFKGWDPLLLLGQEVTGKVLGIVGAGRIGTAVAMRSRGFGMRILYYNRSRSAVLEGELGAERVALEELLRESDFVSVHVPLTPETRHMIGERELGMMKKTAVLVNTARGPVMDEKALVKALRERRIFAAGLDVYEHEPLLEEGLAELDNVVLMPHAGSATFRARGRMALMVASNMLEGLSGRVPDNCVNPEAVKNRR
jgi:D-3-phosphoglycerate dehydrogenase